MFSRGYIFLFTPQRRRDIFWMSRGGHRNPTVTRKLICEVDHTACVIKLCKDRFLQKNIDHLTERYGQFDKHCDKVN